MDQKQREIIAIINLARQMTLECLKEAPNLDVIEKLTGETHEILKGKAFFRACCLEIDENSSNHLKATHLALLTLDFRIQDLFGLEIVFDVNFERILQNANTPPLEKVMANLYNVIRNLHEAQMTIEKIKKGQN